MVMVNWSRRSSRPSTIILVKRLGLASGFLEDVVVEDVGNAQRADDGDGLDLGLAPGTEDLGDDPFPFAVRRGIAGHLERHLIARPGPLRPGVADGDGIGEGGAVDLDVTRAISSRK